MQTKRESIMESILNQVIGFILAIGMYHYIVPIVTGVETTTSQSAIVVIMFTVVSILRSYILRRYCNKITKKRLEN